MNTREGSSVENRPYTPPTLEERIANLEAFDSNVLSDLDKDHIVEKLIAALEHERREWHEQENHLIDLCAEHEKRIAALEEGLNDFDNWVKESFVSKRWIENIEILEERIAALETRVTECETDLL